MENMEKSVPKSKPLSGQFVKCPVRLLERADISPEARILWLVLAAHCFGESRTCKPGIVRLSSFLGRSTRWTRELVTVLEGKGLVHVTRSRGRANVYRLMEPAKPGKSTSLVDEKVRNSTSSLEGEVRNSTSPVQQKVRKSTSGVVRKSTSPESDVLESDKSTSSPSETPPATEKSKPAKKSPATQATVESEINSLDLGKFAKKYPSLHIPTEHEKFLEHFLFKNDAQTGKPNWRKWNDWNRAFHRWCRTAMEYLSRRNPPPRTNSPANQSDREPPDITGKSLDEICYLNGGES